MSTSQIITQIKSRVLEEAFQPAEDKALVRSTIQKLTSDNASSVSDSLLTEYKKWTEVLESIEERKKSTVSQALQESLDKQAKSIRSLLEALPGAVEAFITPKI